LALLQTQSILQSEILERLVDLCDRKPQRDLARRIKILISTRPASKLLPMVFRSAVAPPLLSLPTGHAEVAAFHVNWVRTWGNGSVADAPYKAELREKAGLANHEPDGRTYLFALRVYWQNRRTIVPHQRPDVENVAKLVTDAFTGYLYEDDDLRFVCGVQSECFGVPDDSAERTEVWIFALRET
jgi:hypothetical protein